jgi:hypothetical protein
MTTKQDSKSTEPPKKVHEGKSKIYVDVIKSSTSDKDNGKREIDVPQKLTFLPKTIRTDSENISHQDGLTQLNTKTLSLVIFFLPITLVIKQ